MAYTTINKSTDYFNTLLYAGSGSAQTVTGVGFNSDFTWIKSRNNTHAPTLFAKPLNSGLSHLYSNSTDAAGTGKMTSYNSDGYALPNNNETNNSGNNYVSWNWLANGVGSSNTAGSINTIYTSANQTAGFSIVRYTGNGSAGATIGHGLGVAPKFIIVKSDSDNYNWTVYYGDPTDYLVLNGTDATTDSNEVWNDVAPSSTVFTVGNRNSTNQNTATFVAYCFAPIKGFSAMGSYVGNGNVNGAFIYTGFKPAWILMKDIGRAESWYIYSNKILGYNGQMGDFLANTSASVGNNYAIQVDMLSNGFKLHTTASHLNGDGENFVYLAFAEAPLVGSNNQPANAR